MQSVWEEQFKIKSYEADPEGKVRVPSIFNYFQEVAGNHAAKLNVGFDEMHKKGLLWVLSRIKITINKLPRWGEEIKIKTWPKGIDKLFALRDFIVIDSSGSELINATSAWLVVDNRKFKLHKIEELDVPIPNNDGRYSIHGLLDKIKAAENLAQLMKHKIQFSDIDFVYHTSNTRYPALIMDCYSPEFHKSNLLEYIQINYLEQLRFDETLEIRSNMSDNPQSHYFEGIKEDTNSRIFQCILNWKQLT